MVQVMRTVVYNIPVHLVPTYRGREVVVRFQDPTELVQACSLTVTSRSSSACSCCL